MRLLVTNDDGATAPGIVALARALAEAGHDIVVAAPDTDMSGSGAAIGRIHLDETIDVTPVKVDGLDGIPIYAVAGPPALAVMAARLGAFGEEPEMVVSGINPGANTGHSTLHSGTVGAALTAANFGVSGLAVSTIAGRPYHWGTAAGFAVVAVDWVADQPKATVLNLNVPNRPLGEVLGVRWAQLAGFGSVRAALVESGGLQMELTEPGEELPADSDAALVAAGYAAFTCITGIQAEKSRGSLEVFEQRLLRRSA